MNSVKADFTSAVIVLALLIWALIGLCLPTPSPAFDLSVHENQRGIAAHFGVGTAFTTGFYMATWKSGMKPWQKMICGVVGSLFINTMYEMATEKPFEYALAMDLSCVTGAFMVGSAVQLGIWESENKATGIQIIKRW